MTHDIAHDARGKTRFTFVVEDAANDTQTVYSRLKQLLKTTLRAYKLRCIECRASDGAEVQQ
jgi:hypothetical protein